MLNEEKVRYMTELAIFEKNEGKKIFPINRYFKKDYVDVPLIFWVYLLLLSSASDVGSL